MIGPTVFAAVVWGAVLLVGAVFVYELFVITTDWRT